MVSTNVFLLDNLRIKVCIHFESVTTDDDANATALAANGLFSDYHFTKLKSGDSASNKVKPKAIRNPGTFYTENVKCCSLKRLSNLSKPKI